MNRPDQQQARDFLRKQVKELEMMRRYSTGAVNAVLAKEQFQKWKKQILLQIADKVGPTYAQELRKDWLETAFASADLSDELTDDIEMCLRHLSKILKDIETRGLQPVIPANLSD